MNDKKHVTVMLKEAVDFLQIEKGAWYVDCTFGRGGHTEAILKEGAKVIAFDFDQESVEKGKERFAKEIKNGNLILIRENFNKLTGVLEKIKKENKISEISGILFDFGTSTDQLMSENRGFSFSNEYAELDMRMDGRLGVKASDLLKVLTTKEVARIFREFGGEGRARAIAKNIENMKYENPENLNTVGALLMAVSQTYGNQKGKKNPATKVFQALRIVVNDEINNIEQALPQALENVKPEGRIVTISFHEGEDRLAKQTFSNWESNNKGEKVRNKAIKASKEEVLENPRSRSARLRVFERNAS
jgi:16S rRNA (cytosine1402-N4)-methyltransferase